MTTREGTSVDDALDEPVPGLVEVWTPAGARLRVLSLDGDVRELGRDDAPDDDLVSRQHARVKRAGKRWLVEDLASRNGTFVNGRKVVGSVAVGPPAVLRLGHTIYLLRDDVRPLAGATIEEGDAVVGPTLRRALDAVAHAARTSEGLLISGESGVGKELAARAFHAAGPFAAGPFVAVNCAAIPVGIAERLLFGVVKGAYSGATADARGYLESAHHGTLFLDEVGELDPAVQAKLLRVLETREVLPLGATRARAIDTRVCFATLASLREAIRAGRFRADLYFRIARPEVELPPLRVRLEEIPFLVQREARAADRPVHARLLEACLCRPWPGNVRELLGAIRAALGAAARAGVAVARVADLDPTAGLAPDEGAVRISPDEVSAEAVAAALEAAGGNRAEAARALGLHRSQLYRLLARYGLD